MMEQAVIRIHPWTMWRWRCGPCPRERPCLWTDRLCRSGRKIPFGHKVALDRSGGGEMVGQVRGPDRPCRPGRAGTAGCTATTLKTNLEGLLDYQYAPAAARKPEPVDGADTFLGYRRSDGRVGTRTRAVDHSHSLPCEPMVSRMAEGGQTSGAPGGDGSLPFPHNACCPSWGMTLRPPCELLRNLVKPQCRRRAAGEPGL